MTKLFKEIDAFRSRIDLIRIEGRLLRSIESHNRALDLLQEPTDIKNVGIDTVKLIDGLHSPKELQ